MSGPRGWVNVRESMSIVADLGFKRNQKIHWNSMHVLAVLLFSLFLRPPKSQLKKVVGQNGKQDAHGVSKKAHPNDEQIQRNRTFVTLFRAHCSTRCSRHRKDIVTSFSTTQDFSLHGYLSEKHVGLFSQFDNSRFSILERDFNTENPSLHLLSP